MSKYTYKRNNNFITYLRKLLRQRRISAAQLAMQLGLSHAAVSRWLSGMDIPNPRSCQKLAEYSGDTLENMLAIAGHTKKKPQNREKVSFREFARQHYPNELDDDIVEMIEHLIEVRRKSKHDR